MSRTCPSRTALRTRGNPLIAIADLADGDWPARARKAAIALNAEDDTDTTLGSRLLAALRDVFDEADAMHGERVLGALHKISEAPWVTTSAAR